MYLENSSTFVDNPTSYSEIYKEFSTFLVTAKVSFGKRFLVPRFNKIVVLSQSLIYFLKLRRLVVALE